MTSTTLNSMLNQHLKLPPEYRGGMTNHLPMVLHALQSLGASAARMHEFARVYVQRFQRVTQPAGAAVFEGDWRDLRGQPDSYAALHGAFTVMLESQGVDTTLRAVLPDLWTGVAAAAFHGVIRSAHAVQAGHRAELAQALAYWAWRWQPVDAVASGPQALLDPQAWTSALKDAAGNWRSPRGLISERMTEVQTTPFFADLAGCLQPAPGELTQTLRPLAAFAAERYAVTRNLTVLHMVTACRAASVLAPWLEDTPAQRGQLARAYAAAWLSSGVGAIAPLAPAAPATWEEVVAAALQSDDDHVVKLVHACRDFEAQYGPGPWLAAATRAIRVP